MSSDNVSILPFKHDFRARSATSEEYMNDLFDSPLPCKIIFFLSLIFIIDLGIIR